MASISLNVQCDVAPEKLTVLTNFLYLLLPDVSIPNLEHLQEIRIVPDNLFGTAVNNLLQSGKDQGTYIPGDSTTACAVPVEKDTDLECIVVLCESFVQKINPLDPDTNEIVITLLEELLHVQHYSTLWQHYGYIHSSFEDICTLHLFKICFRFYDEYIVNRWKWAFLARRLKGSDPFTLSDFPLVTHLDQAQAKLFTLIYKAATKSISQEEAWLSIIHFIHRDIFDLLARYAAPIAEIPQEQMADTPIDLSKSPFYQTFVASYWQQIEKELESAYATDLKTAYKALDNIVSLVKDFLANIGVTYHKAAGGECHIDFKKIAYL